MHESSSKRHASSPAGGSNNPDQFHGNAFLYFASQQAAGFHTASSHLFGGSHVLGRQSTSPRHGISSPREAFSISSETSTGFDRPKDNREEASMLSISPVVNVLHEPPKLPSLEDGDDSNRQENNVDGHGTPTGHTSGNQFARRSCCWWLILPVTDIASWLQVSPYMALALLTVAT